MRADQRKLTVCFTRKRGDGPLLVRRRYLFLARRIAIEWQLDDE
jgi:hypothetical protein